MFAATHAILNYLRVTLFVAFFLIVGLAFPFTSPESYLFKLPVLEYLINRYSYFAVVLFAFLALLASLKKEHSFDFQLMCWISYFSVIIYAMLFSDNTRLNISILYLLFFLAPALIQLHRVPILTAIGAAICFNALYSVAGMVAAHLKCFDAFPLIPYVHIDNHNSAPGFYGTFSPALYLQTNAAGAIFGASFCFFLYQVINENCRSSPLWAITFGSLIGLLLTRSLSALLLGSMLCVIALRGRSLSVFLIALLVYVSLILLIPDGILGLNIAYLQHKIESSALTKISLLAENLRLLMDGGVWAMIMPGREPPLGTENSFVDMAYQFGLVQLVGFYGWCIISLRVIEDRSRALLLFPILLSFVQNSTFTTPSVIIFGVALAIYGNKAISAPPTEGRNVSVA